VTAVRDLFDLTGRRAVVTGAGLLGRVFADGLAGAGASVVLIDVDRRRLDGVVEGLAARHDGRVSGRACDITDTDAVQTTVGALAAEGAFDALVNSAAVDPKFEPDETGAYADNGAFPTYSADNWRRSLEVNLTGTFLMTQAICRRMEQVGRGAVVNISSTYGLTGPDQRIYERSGGGPRFFKPVDYSVTKAGILGFTKAVATYYRGTAIRVNALTPGGAFNDHDPEFVANYSSRTVLGRMAQPDEYRGAIVFLCSEASSYMTGANLVVDGGWTTL